MRVRIKFNLLGQQLFRCDAVYEGEGEAATLLGAIGEDNFSKWLVMCNQWKKVVIYVWETNRYVQVGTIENLDLEG